MREEGEEEEEVEDWEQSREMNQLHGIDPKQHLKYTCHQCGQQTTHSLLLVKETSLNSSLDTINLAVNQTRRRRKRRRRR